VAAEVALEFQGAWFRHTPQASDVLRGVDLVVSAGQSVLLRGPSGCGKSTLLSLAAGVQLPTRGTVRLLGVDWHTLRPAQRDQRRADHVGLIFQQFNLLPYLSVLDNVLLGTRFSPRRQMRALHVRPERSLEDIATDLLVQLNVPKTHIRAAVSDLSIGQQQRVAAARALLGEPELVLADEPTSALDDRHRDQFLEVLMAQCERVGCALVMVSHDSRIASRFSHVIEWPGGPGDSP
jgi:putative ABC transport system ATP-binding protein